MNKLVKAFIALAAFAAFAVLPAAASATNNPQLWQPTNSLLGVPATIVATNEGPTLMTDTEGNILTSCQTATLTGTLVTNSHGGGVAGNITTATFQGDPSKNPPTHLGHCFGATGPTTPTPTGLPWCLRSDSTMGTDTFQVRGGDCSKAATAIQFTLDVTTFFGTIQCGFQRVAGEPITGTNNTHTAGKATMSINKVVFKKYHGSELCPSHGLLDMNFFLYRETSTPQGTVEDDVFIRDVT